MRPPPFAVLAGLPSQWPDGPLLEWRARMERSLEGLASGQILMAASLDAVLTRDGRLRTAKLLRC